MKTMQEKITGNLVSRLGTLFGVQYPHLNLELVRQPNWSNTGIIYVQPEFEPKTYCAIHYEFHSSYCTLTFAKAGQSAVQTTETYAYAQYSESGAVTEAITKMVNRVAEALRAA